MAFENCDFFILKNVKNSKKALLEHMKFLNQNTQLVSYIFLDYDQLLTYAYPPKKDFGTPYGPDQSVIVTTSME